MQKRTIVTPAEFETLVPWSMTTIRRKLKRGALPSFQPDGPNTGWLIDFDAFTNQFRTSENAADQTAAGSEKDRTPKLSGPKPKWLNNPRKKMNRPNEGTT